MIMEKLSDDWLLRIYNGLDNLYNETVTRIEKIEKRLYSGTFFDDLLLDDYNRFFEETIRYLNTKLTEYEIDSALKDGVKKLIQESAGMPFLEKKNNFLSLLSSVFRDEAYGFVYIENTVNTLRAVRDQTQNIMDWLKVQLC